MATKTKKVKMGFFRRNIYYLIAGTAAILVALTLILVFTLGRGVQTNGGNDTDVVAPPIVFSAPVDSSTITNSSVVLSSGGTPVDAALVLDATGTTLTVTPTSLASGTAYTLALSSAIMSSDGSTTPLTTASLGFTTQSFAIQSVTATADDTTVSSLQVTLNNLTSGAKTANFRVEIRRDLGARIDDGGTVVYISPDKSLSASVPTGSDNPVTLNLNAADITQDVTGGDPATGSTYIDVYVLDGQGNQIGDAYHMQLN